jgi:hypothetical protein
MAAFAKTWRRDAPWRDRVAPRGARAGRHASDRLPQRKIGTGHWTGRDIAGHLSRTWVGQDGTPPIGCPGCPTVPVRELSCHDVNQIRSRPQLDSLPMRRVPRAACRARFQALRSASDRSPSPP